MNRDSSVDIETDSRLDGLGSFPSSEKIFLFSIASIPALRPTDPPIQRVPVDDFPG
jgi:hypothetical protein